MRSDEFGWHLWEQVDLTPKRGVERGRRGLQADIPPRITDLNLPLCAFWFQRQALSSLGHSSQWDPQTSASLVTFSIPANLFLSLHLRDHESFPTGFWSSPFALAKSWSLRVSPSPPKSSDSDGRGGHIFFISWTPNSLAITAHTYTIPQCVTPIAVTMSLFDPIHPMKVWRVLQSHFIYRFCTLLPQGFFVLRKP